jgi:hypothetical protein
MASKTTLAAVEDPSLADGNTESKTVVEKEAVSSIAKPDGPFSLDKFKSKRAAAVAGVETLQTGLPHYPIAHAKDWATPRRGDLLVTRTVLC